MSSTSHSDGFALELIELDHLITKKKIEEVRIRALIAGWCVCGGT